MQELRSRSKKKLLSINVGTKPERDNRYYYSKRDEALKNNFINTGRKSEACLKRRQFD